MAENDATQPDATEQEIEQGFKDESEEAQEEFKEEFVDQTIENDQIFVNYGVDDGIKTQKNPRNKSNR